MSPLVFAGILLICTFSSGQDRTHPLPIEVTITPAKATVFSGETLTFVATVVGVSTQAVDWSVDEKDGGSVSAMGVYTAPKLQGVYHVIATSRGRPDVKAVATITVLAYCDPLPAQARR